MEIDPITVYNYIPTSNTNEVENKIYSMKSSDIEILEIKDNFLLFNILNRFDRTPDLNDPDINNKITEMIYQKNKYDQNKEILKEIDNKKFNNNKFLEIGKKSIQNLFLDSINDNTKFESNSIKILYSLPLNSYTLISDSESNIYLIKIKNFFKNEFNKNDENFLKFKDKMITDSKTSILKSYDLFLNNKYNVELNQKTIERVKNYFK